MDEPSTFGVGKCPGFNSSFASLQAESIQRTTHFPSKHLILLEKCIMIRCILWNSSLSITLVRVVLEQDAILYPLNPRLVWSFLPLSLPADLAPPLELLFTSTNSVSVCVLLTLATNALKIS